MTSESYSELNDLGNVMKLIVEDRNKLLNENKQFKIKIGKIEEIISHAEMATITVRSIKEILGNES